LKQENSCQKKELSLGRRKRAKDEIPEQNQFLCYYSFDIENPFIIIKIHLAENYCKRKEIFCPYSKTCIKHMRFPAKLHDKNTCHRKYLLKEKQR
jgi:hypothetical protein